MLDLSYLLNRQEKLEILRKRVAKRKQECSDKDRHKHEIVERITGSKVYYFCAYCYTHYNRLLKGPEIGKYFN